MVRALVVVVVGAIGAGCYAPSIPGGVACVTACPGDQICVAGTCRAPGPGDDAAIDAPLDGAPGVDTDGDGSADDLDNCVAVVNADQHDEDRDDLGDVCDPCPHAASGAAADQDQDGVGDACDPEPAIAKQRWALFDPFTSRRAAWSSTNQAVFANDQMTLTGDIRLTLSVSDARYVAAGTVTIGAGTPHQAIISFAHTSGSQHYYAEFYDFGAGGSIKLTRTDGTTYNTVVGNSYPGSIPEGAFSWVIDFSVTDQTVGFSASHGATTFPTVSGPAGTAPPLVPTTYSWFGAGSVTVVYDYFAVIESI